MLYVMGLEIINLVYFENKVKNRLQSKLQFYFFERESKELINRNNGYKLNYKNQIVFNKI